MLWDIPASENRVRVPLWPTQAEIDAAGGSRATPYDHYSLYYFSPHISLQATNLLNVHPNGHYSAYATGGAGSVIDVIAHASGNRTTHKAMFDKAFKQTRDYADYDSSGVFSGGMFATAGMWV
jgi:hypothetical protein